MWAVQEDWVQRFVSFVIDAMVVLVGGLLLESVLSYLCFFFQAEDGIRDYKVTGVQTCALPILPGHDRTEVGQLRVIDTQKRGDVFVHRAKVVNGRAPQPGEAVRVSVDVDRRKQIGRASCRERV